jgi:hypothetical protein
MPLRSGARRAPDTNDDAELTIAATVSDIQSAACVLAAASVVSIAIPWWHGDDSPACRR